MDLIYANDKREELGVLIRPVLDLAFGEDENNFSCKLDLKHHCCEQNYYIYAEGTEYGGIVDGTEIDTADKTVTYIGRTWHGILAKKVIEPLMDDETADDGVTVATSEENGALVVSGDANDCLRWIIKRIGLDDLFLVPDEPTGVNIDSYQFERYVDAYTGLRGMLDSAGLRLSIRMDYTDLTVTAVKRWDYSVDQEFEGELIDYRMSKHYNAPNHLVCLGAGEGSGQIVVHLYADAEGNISEEQTFSGVDEYTEVYDAGGNLTATDDPETEENEAAAERAKARAKLVESGMERLKELRDVDEIDVDFDAEDDNYYIGDIVGAYESTTGISTAAAVSKKIVTIQNGKITVSYQVAGPTTEDEEQEG